MEEAEGKGKQKPFLPAASMRQSASTGSVVSADSSESTLTLHRTDLNPRLTASLRERRGC